MHVEPTRLPGHPRSISAGKLLGILPYLTTKTLATSYSQIQAYLRAAVCLYRGAKCLIDSVASP